MDTSKKHLRGAFLFGAIGVINTATDFAVYAGGVSIGVSLILANGLAFVVANIQSYVLNAVVTFRREGRSADLSLRGYGRFLAAHLAGLVVSTAIIVLLADILGPYIAKIVAVLAAFVLNYTFSALFVFRD